ncbi:MAG TPA: glucose 1-dehydrogenase [Cytophagaceae bacterium]|jgi:threonine dehydrogenase-like Zn-dependent dehydrogenase|nr:glucose 1-dehydrogenase [Cytophagaceae bacterium]
MKAIATTPGSKELRIVEREEPKIYEADDIKIKITQIGICGTDREIAHGGRADAPAGSNELVLGHEMIGIVVEIGKDVKKVKVGDHALFTVRRACGSCYACANGRNDMCSTGNYTERGIRGRDGYMTEYVVDKELYCVKIPDNIVDLGVLTEPISVSVKAVDEAVKIQAARIPGATYDTWLNGKKVLVVGLGPIGLLGAFILRLRGADVLGMDIVEENSPRASLLKEIGGNYINGKTISADLIDDTYGQIDMVFEAAGVAKLGFDLIDALGINGVYVLTGVPGAGRPVDISGGALMQQMVLMNQVMVGSVNASMQHNLMALDVIANSKKTWPGSLEKVITEVMPYTKIKEAIANTSSDEIKTIITF